MLVKDTLPDFGQVFYHLKLNEQGNKQMTWLNPLDEAHFAVSTIQASSRSKVNLIRNTRDSHKISG